MSDLRDFAMDTGDLEGAASLQAVTPVPTASAAEPAPEATPKVVIQYRNRGMHRALLPPLLFMVTALVITSYQRQTGLRPIARPATPRNAAEPATAAGTGRIIMVEASGTGAAIEPITVRTALAPAPPPTSTPTPTPEPAPAIASAATPAADDPFRNVQVVGLDLPPLSDALPISGPPSSFDQDGGAARNPQPPPVAEPRAPARPLLEPPVPLRSAWAEPLAPDSPELAFRVVAATGPDAAPPAEPKKTKEQFHQELLAESAQKQAEQRNLELEVAQSKRRQAVELLERTQAERTKFHAELRRIVDQFGDNAGPDIRDLCDRYGRDMPDDVKKAMTIALRRTAASAKREVKFALMRWFGAPEPMLLDVLANEIDRTRKQRNGPRDQNEVRVRAALQLLRYPPAEGPPERPPGNTATRVYRPAQ